MIRNLLGAAFCFLIFNLAASTSSAEETQPLALVGAKVYSSPSAAPLLNAVVLTAGGVITEIGERGAVHVPKDARVIDCTPDAKVIDAAELNKHPWKGAHRILFRTRNSRNHWMTDPTFHEDFTFIAPDAAQLGGRGR